MLFIGNVGRYARFQPIYDPYPIDGFVDTLAIPVKLLTKEHFIHVYRTCYTSMEIDVNKILLHAGSFDLIQHPCLSRYHRSRHLDPLMLRAEV